jgi:guanylate kinase
MVQEGNLIVVSGPSGSGKTTLAMSAVKELPNLKYAVSYTTRPPRAGELQGIDYFFVAKEEFDRMLAAGELVEWATVYGNDYGRGKSFIVETLARGEDVIMAIDVQGARSMKRVFPQAILVFILPPNRKVLIDRLRHRGLDDEPTIQRRMSIACEELLAYHEYDYLIVNDVLEKAKQELHSIISALRCRRERQEAAAQQIVKTFK